MFMLGMANTRGYAIVVLVIAFSVLLYMSYIGVYTSAATPDVFKEWVCGSGLSCTTDDCGTYKKVANSDYELTFNADPGIYECEMQVKSCCYGFDGTVPEQNEYVDVYLNGYPVGSTDDLFCNDEPSGDDPDPPPDEVCMYHGGTGNEVLTGTTTPFTGNSFCFKVTGINSIPADDKYYGRKPMMVLAGNNNRHYLIVRYRVDGTQRKVAIRAGFCFKCSVDYPGSSWCEIAPPGKPGAWFDGIEDHTYKVTINGCNVIFRDMTTGESVTMVPIEDDSCPDLYDNLDLGKYCVTGDNCQYHGTYRWIDESVGFVYDPSCSGNGGNGEICFAAGTKISMADRTTRNIEDVKEGDAILSWDFDKQEMVTNEVYSTWSGPHDGMYIINGETHVTPEHPFWTKEKGWASIKPSMTLEAHGWEPSVLEIGYHLVDVNGNHVEVESIEPDFGEVMTYNFLTAGPRNYYANGVLVHNKEINGPVT